MQISKNVVSGLLGWEYSMDDYCFFFVHPYNLKIFSKEKNDHHYPRICIKSLVIALDTKLNWLKKKIKCPAPVLQAHLTL